MAVSSSPADAGFTACQFRLIAFPAGSHLGMVLDFSLVPAWFSTHHQAGCHDISQIFFSMESIKIDKFDVPKGQVV